MHAGACRSHAISLAQEQGFSYWLAYGLCYVAGHWRSQGQRRKGSRRSPRACSLSCDRSRGRTVVFSGVLAEAHGNHGTPEAGLTVLAEALTIMDKTGERVWKPELYRLKGVLLLQQSSDNQAEAETCFHHALDMARTQQAKSFELRAATSLARLWQQQGKRQEAHDLLAPVYHWFTEGFDTADLQDAKALLDELA